MIKNKARRLDQELNHQEKDVEDEEQRVQAAEQQLWSQLSQAWSVSEIAVHCFLEIHCCCKLIFIKQPQHLALY